MLGKEEKIALLLLIGITVVTMGSYTVLESVGKGPFATQYEECSDEGALVSLQGDIEEVNILENGGHVILTISGIRVFIPAPVAAGYSFRKGDPISLYGTVQTYRGDKEIVVGAAGDIAQSRSAD
jgi:DNA/RNA endonuclease YhcR with UshA esterase domain